jgi:hypothetical protein
MLPPQTNKTNTAHLESKCYFSDITASPPFPPKYGKQTHLVLTHKTPHQENVINTQISMLTIATVIDDMKPYTMNLFDT